jgi:NAD(P)-dependent dehydrogenase (short-subunit alcohol dehydrogenase family)
MISEISLDSMNKILLIGGNGLIGRKVSVYLKKLHYEIIIADIEVPSDANKIKGVEYVKVDIGSKSSFSSVLFGSKYNITCIINLAYPRGSGYGNDLMNVTLSDFNTNISLHLGGYFNVMKVAAGFFLERKIKGQVISISSIYGVIQPKFELYEGLNMTSPVEYTCIKHSIVALSKYFAKYFLKEGLSFNTVSYGGVLDNQHPTFIERYSAHSGQIGMLHTEGHLGVSLKYLIEAQGQGVTGQNLIVDDGFTL